MKVEPYLMFEGRCEEAIEFYKKAIGAEVAFLMRYKDSPEPPQPGMIPPGSENKVMHATLRVGTSDVMMSDGCASGTAKFAGINLSLSVPSDAEAKRKFDALAEGGNVHMPLGKTFFASSFGMLQDRFGVSWMVIVAP
jgi:PhnB protein